MTLKYKLEAGRCITFEGVPICSLHKIGDDAIGYSMNAADMDDFAKNVVDALNCSQHVPAMSRNAPRVTLRWMQS